MYGYGLYNITRKELSEVLYSVFLLSIIFTIWIMGVCFVVRDAALAYPRSVLFLSGMFYLIFLMSWRGLVWWFECKISGFKKIAIFSTASDNLSSSIAKKFNHFYKIEYEGDELENIEEMEVIINAADEVFIGCNIKPEVRDKAVSLCVKYQKNVFYIPKYHDISLMSATLNKTDDIPTLFIASMESSPEELFVKRFFDILLASLASVVLLPFGLIIVLLVKLDGGSVFYSQERVTRNNRVFRILKFRTMIPDAEKHSGPVLAGEDDPRITKIGRILRAARLDEIPQLFNILKGDMSVVGPRPERPFFVEQFEREIPEYNYRHRMKAGLTGLAQVEGKYNTTVENKLRYDLIYINNYSIWRDFLIIIQTVKILFMKESTEGVNN
jgi:exopolysaccharide biosynthesis polyprenyl glycosylphosphotransferase